MPEAPAALTPIPTNCKETDIMKKSIMKFGLFLALAGSLLCACNEKQEPEKPGNGTVTKLVLSASLPDTQTKTSLSDTYDILWNTGDRISVNGTLSEPVSSADNGKDVVDFTVNGTLSEPFNVLYPGTTSTNVISLPATQNYVADSFDGAAVASFGTATKKGNIYNVSLTNFCGLIRLALNGSATLDRIELNSLGSEKLRGNFTISDFSTGAFSGGTAGTLTYSFGSNGLALSSSDTYVYIALPAQAYASGLEALVYQKDGAFMRLKFWGSGYTLANTDIIGFDSKTFAAGRTENLFEIGNLAAENGGAPTLTPPTITVATFNTMRMDDDDRPAAALTGGSNGALDRPADAIRRSNSAMQAALGLAIYNTAADIIGFNEIGDASYNTSRPYSIQTMATDQGVSGYSWDLDWKSGDSYKYCNGFAYRSSVLDLESSGKVWLNESSATYDSSDTNPGSPKRTIIWCLFTHKTSGKQFYFFITQLPTTSQTSANTNMSGGVNAFANSKGTTLPKILVGDLNNNESNENSAGYTELKTYWTDAWEVMSAANGNDWYYNKNKGTQSGTGLNYQYSIAQFTKNHPERRLDHIMVRNGSSGKAVVKSYRTIRNTYTVSAEGYDDILCAPSDHLPVVCEITLE